LSDHIPTAEIIAQRFYAGVHTTRVLCPGCHRTHVHRWAGDSGPYTGACGTVYIIGGQP
jgi:hypothetical protein